MNTKNISAASTEHPFRWLFVIIPVAVSIQFGGQNTLFSISFLAFLVCWSAIGVRNIDLLEAVSILLLMSLSLLWQTSNPKFFDLCLRTAREFVVLLLLVSTTRYAGRRVHPQILVLAAFGIQVLCIGLSTIQLFGLLRGSPIGFLPYQLYGNIAGDDAPLGDSRVTTIPSAWLEFGESKLLHLGEELIVRPVGFYTEPSYLAFVMLCCSYLVEISAETRPRLVLYSYLASVFTALICSSASGVVCASVLAAAYILRHSPPSARLSTGLALAIFGTILLVTTVGTRLSGSLSAEGDISGFVRLVLPVINIVRTQLDGYVFGITSGTFFEILDPYLNGVDVGLGIDNAMWNFILAYGFSGIILFSCIPRRFGWNNALFIVLAMQSNGNFLGYDKGAIVSFILMQYYATRNRFQDSERSAFDSNRLP